MALDWWLRVLLKRPPQQRCHSGVTMLHTQLPNTSLHVVCDLLLARQLCARRKMCSAQKYDWVAARACASAPAKYFFKHSHASQATNALALICQRSKGDGEIYTET